MTPLLGLMLLILAGEGDAGLDARLRDLTPEWEVAREPMMAGFHNLYNPCVVHEPGSAYPFKMWFFGWAAADNNLSNPVPGDAIYFARGKSLHDWQVYAGGGRWTDGGDAGAFAPVMYGAPGKAYDGMANGDPSVVKRGDTYYMALSSVGFDARKDEEGVERLYLVNCVLGATSEDGVQWAKTDGPIAMWEREFEEPWEIVDGKIPPAPEGYMGGYHRPALMWDEGRWRLWFDYFLEGTFVSMGYAENRGDFREPGDWEVIRAGKEPLLRDWPNACVVKHGGTYYSFSDAPNYPAAMGGDGRQLTMAVSPDGFDWTVQGHIRPHGLASSHVPEALVLERGGAPWLYVFYAWKPARKEGEPWDFRYKALRYMRKRLEPPAGQP